MPKLGSKAPAGSPLISARPSSDSTASRIRRATAWRAVRRVEVLARIRGIPFTKRQPVRGLASIFISMNL
jgi:hypothetical protein